MTTIAPNSPGASISERRSVRRVSVCIPTVDRIDLLREAIGSVASQTWRDFEIVVADNSGNSEGQQRIDRVLAEFPDLTFVLRRHPRRVHIIENFNCLIDTAQGEFWTCLTDDDRWRPTFLARSVEALDRNPECAFSFADHWIIRADGTIDLSASDRSSAVFGRSELREGVYLQDKLFDLALKQCMCLQTAMFRRPTIALARFIPGIMCGDLSLFLRLSASPHIVGAYYLDERVFEYRVHASQLTTTTDSGTHIRAKIAAYESVTGLPRRARRALNHKLSSCHLAVAFLDAEQGNVDSARHHAVKSLHSAVGLRNTVGGILVVAAPFSVRPLRRLRTILKGAGVTHP